MLEAALLFAALVALWGGREARAAEPGDAA
jgi:hypothetical protein